MRFTHVLLLASAYILGQEAQALSMSEIDYHMENMDTFVLAAEEKEDKEVSKIKKDVKKKVKNFSDKLLKQEHDRFDIMDIDEDGKVTLPEFKAYWKQHLKKEYGFTPPKDMMKQYLQGMEVTFHNIAGKNDSFTWKDYKKFLTEVDIEVEKDDKK